jgi:hypothetical protein
VNLALMSLMIEAKRAGYRVVVLYYARRSAPVRGGGAT